MLVAASKTPVRFAIFGMGCVGLSACETAPAVIDDASLTGTQIAENVMAWWPGDYSNAAQITALREDGAPIWRQGQYEDGQAFGGHLPVSSYYRGVEMPAFGDRVLYLEEFTFDDNPYRQRIYTISVDEADQVRVKLWYFPDKTTYAGAWQDLDMIATLTPEDMSPLPDNCDLLVSETDDGRLHMMMPKDQCKFGESIFDYQVSLSASDFWFRDRIVNAETMEVTMTAGSFTYHKLDRLSD
ncbi:MAG: chromophore lyase CpcT/CpeT [Pseudomonadota bacterium]